MMFNDLLGYFGCGLECLAIIRDHLHGYPSPCGKPLEASDECRSGQICDKIQVNCMSDTTDKET